MRTAVFGGSGRVGTALLPALAERGHEISALQHRAPVPVGNADIVSGDIADPDCVRGVIEDCDAVLHMIKLREGAAQVANVSVRGLLNVLDAVCESDSVRHVVVTSSDAAVGIWYHPYDKPVDHDTPPMSYPGYYSLSKVLEETIVREYGRHHDLPYTVVRLSYVQQEDSLLRHLVCGLDPSRPGKGPFSGCYGPEQKRRAAAGERFAVLPVTPEDTPLGRTVVQRQDVVDGLVSILGNGKVKGRTLHLSGPGFSYEDACAYAAERLSIDVERVPVPGVHSFDIDCSLTTELTGWEPRFDIRAMIDAAIEWSHSDI
jgi:nucleoside-diphosphate-sugar epimerase